MEPTTPALATAPPSRDLRRRCRRPSSDGGKGTGKGAVRTYSCVPTWPFQGIKNYKVQLPSPEAETDSEPRPRAFWAHWNHLGTGDKARGNKTGKR